MDCTSCNNEECKQIQTNLTDSYNLWSDVLRRLTDAIATLAKAECDYAHDPAALPALSLATDTVFSVFSEIQSLSTPLSSATEKE